MDEGIRFEFKHENVETILLNGEPLFNPYHVGKCLNLEKTTVRDHISEMDVDERVLVKNSDVDSNTTRTFNNRGEVFVTESGIYMLIFVSRKPEAKKFKKWVAHEVLPTIRKTGKYETQNNQVMEKMLADFLNTYENITGMKKEEIPIQQNQSERAKLANLINDISKREQIGTRALYDRLYYAYASEFGVLIPELAEKSKIKTSYYLRKHALLAENIYNFALKFFFQGRNIVELMRPPDQSTLGEF